MVRLLFILALALAAPRAAEATATAGERFMPHVPSYFLSINLAGVRDKLPAPLEARPASLEAGGSCNLTGHGPGHAAAAVLLILGSLILIVARRRWS